MNLPPYFLYPFRPIFLFCPSTYFPYPYPLSTLPEHIHSTYFSYAKVTCNTHTQPKEFGFHPSYARSLVSLITTPLLTPFHWESRLHTPKPVISSFWHRTEKTSRCVALLTFVRSLSVYGVKVTGVYYDFCIESSCEVFLHIYSYFNVFYLRFFM